MIGAIILAIVVVLLAIMMDRAILKSNVLDEAEDEDSTVRGRFDVSKILEEIAGIRTELLILGIGTLLAKLAIKFSNQYQVLVLLALLAMVAAMLYVARWWAGYGKTWKAFIYFLLLELIFAWVAGSAATAVTTKMTVVKESGILTSIVKILPLVAARCAVGSAAIGWSLRADRKVLAIVIGVIVALLIIGAIWGGLANVNFAKPDTTSSNESVAANLTGSSQDGNLWEGFKQAVAGNSGTGGQTTRSTVPPTINPSQTMVPQYTSTPVPTNSQQAVWYTFYNLTIQNDGMLNDNDFGPNPYRGDWWSTEYANDMLARISNDPVLGAADIAYFDHVVGTSISGVRYDDNPEKWLANINARAVEFVKDQSLYEKVVDEFVRTLNSGIVQSIDVKLRNDINGLMYMDPNGTANIGGTNIKMPKVIWKSHNEKTYFLVFTVKKANSSATVEALYKLACGYQPPIGNNNNGINPGGNDNPGSGPINPDTPYHKDPTKGTDVGKNDTTGPGPNTNNGVGARESTADQPTDSTSMSYNDNKRTIADLSTVSTNGNQRVGGDPNTPTVSAPSNADVINNADKGTGYSGIDVATNVEGYVQTDGGVAVSGQTEAHFAMSD